MSIEQDSTSKHRHMSVNIVESGVKHHKYISGLVIFSEQVIVV
jgi:hypothetical protein